MTYQLGGEPTGVPNYESWWGTPDIQTKISDLENLTKGEPLSFNPHSQLWEATHTYPVDVDIMPVDTPRAIITAGYIENEPTDMSALSIAYSQPSIQDEHFEYVTTNVIDGKFELDTHCIRADGKPPIFRRAAAPKEGLAVPMGDIYEIAINFLDKMHSFVCVG